jgi:trimeric autotransporter adhesin
MIRKFTRYFVLASVGLWVAGCNDDEVTTPPKPTLQANKSSALVGETVTFTVTQVDADAISILPYGSPSGDAGVLVQNFEGGVQTVTFSYGRPGTFQAVAVANNHLNDGTEVRNVISDPVTIVISSEKNSITEFSFDKVTGSKTVISQANKTINVTVPYGTDITKAKAVYTASPFTTVTVGGVAQESGKTENNFSSPKVYTVTANNGSVNSYTVTVDVVPVQTFTGFKAFTAKVESKKGKDKVLAAHADSVANRIVVYDTLGTPRDGFDSLAVAYELSGKLGRLKYVNSASKEVIVPQNLRFNLSSLTPPKEVTVKSQDSTNASGVRKYDMYAVDAPKLSLEFPTLNPQPVGANKPVNFNYNITVLKGTDIKNLMTTALVKPGDLPAGVTVTNISVKGATFGTGAVDYSKPVNFELTVNDPRVGGTYKVIYTVTVTVAP